MTGGGYSGLRQRVPTALALLAALCVVLFAMPPGATLVLIAVAFLWGAWEW